MKPLILAASLAVLAAVPASAQPATTTTVKTVKTVTEAPSPANAPVGTLTSPSYDSAASMAAPGMPKTETVTTTTTDTTTIPAGAKKIVPVTAPSVKGHKPGDKAAGHVHTATGRDETSDAGDKAAKAVTPLKDSSVPGEGKVEIKGDTLIVH